MLFCVIVIRSVSDLQEAPKRRQAYERKNIIRNYWGDQSNIGADGPVVRMPPLQSREIRKAEIAGSIPARPTNY